MIDRYMFGRIVDELRAAGYADADIESAENCRPPQSAKLFAREAIFVICNSGMKNTVAKQIFDRVMNAIARGDLVNTAFRHEGKVRAIDEIWRNRERYFKGYLTAVDKVQYCGSLPWIGGVTKYHLAKNFGAQVAKPDVHLKRLADLEGCTVQALCERISRESGYKVATVDVLLWRACATGIIDSKTGAIKVSVDSEKAEEEKALARINVAGSVELDPAGRVTVRNFDVEGASAPREANRVALLWALNKIRAAIDEDRAYQQSQVVVRARIWR